MPERRDGNRRRGDGRRDRPPRLGTVRWDSFTHRHMWNMIMDAHPDQVFERYREWRTVGTALVEVNTKVQRELNTLFGSWRGSAAVTAALSNTDLLAWAQEAAERTEEVGEQLGRYGNALVEARKRMPQPRHVDAERAFHSGEGVEVLNGPENSYVLRALMDNNEYTERERREAKQDAIDVMRAFEADALRVEQQVGQGYRPPPTTTPPGDRETIVEVQPSPPWWDPLLPLPPIPPPSDSDTPATTGQQGAGPVHAGSGTGGPGGFGGLGAGGLGAGGLGGSAGAGADSVYGGRGLGGPLVGAAGPGTGAGAMGRGLGAEAAAARGAAGAAGGRGGMLYPPVGGVGARDDDREKRLASYVVADDDLFDDDRPCAPPVFGA